MSGLGKRLAELEASDPDVRRAGEKYDETVRDILKEAESLPYVPPEPVRPKVWLRSGNGVAILGACSKAAGKGGWSHQEWRDFRRKAAALEWEAMFSLVCSRFQVGCASSFSKDPGNWKVTRAYESEDPDED